MTNDDTLTCQEVVELVTDYLENALLPEMRKRLKEHVADYPGCRTYLEQVRQTIGMLHHQLVQEPIFSASKQELLEIFRTWKQGPASG